MKKRLLSLSFMLLAFAFAGAQTKIISGHISSDRLFSNDTIYRLDGFVYVDSLATLTIQPGTIIRGIKANKGSLIITRGGKLIAEGTKDNPIVFTSDELAGTRAAGDWGGVIILGNAPINVAGGVATIEGGVNNSNGDGQYGGNNAADNSGSLKYVRIEYPGIAFSANNEINGLTLGGVGNGTVIGHVQVSFSGDDSFEWFGGTVNGKYLVAHRGLDDDFDTDFGFNGKIQFGVVLRDSLVADGAGDSNGFESDNDGAGSGNTPKTAALFSNITIVGPKATSNTQISTFFKRALRLRRNTEVSAYNSVFMGFPTGLYIEGTAAETNATGGNLQFRNSSIVGCATPLAVASGSSFDINAWYNTAGWNNLIYTSNTDVMLTDPFNYDNPNFMPVSGSPLLTNTVDFSNSRLADPFFIPVTFQGAFGTEDWTGSWTNFNPQNTDYNQVAPDAGFTYSVSNYSVTFTNTSIHNPTSYTWDFGDGNTSTAVNPTHVYASNNNYTVTLVAKNSTGTDTISQVVSITVGVDNGQFAGRVKVYPNPASTSVKIGLDLAKASDIAVDIYDLQGKLVLSIAKKAYHAGEAVILLNVSDLETGIYTARLTSDEGVINRRIAVLKQ